jgi:hypothetical protein
VVAELLFDVRDLVIALTLMEMLLLVFRPAFLDGEGCCAFLKTDQMICLEALLFLCLVGHVFAELLFEVGYLVTGLKLMEMLLLVLLPAFLDGEGCCAFLKTDQRICPKALVFLCFVGHVFAYLLCDVGDQVTALTLMEMLLLVLRPAILDGEGCCALPKTDQRICLKDLPFLCFVGHVSAESLFYIGDLVTALTLMEMLLLVLQAFLP